MGDAAALVVDEAMIGRASGCDQPTDRQRRIAPHVGDLKFGFRFRDVECPAAEQRLQPVANTERQSPDGRDNLELLGLHVGPQRLGQRQRWRRLATGNRG